MKKLLLVFLLSISCTFAQYINPIFLQKKAANIGQSVNLDGSSEYASVTPSLRLTGQFSANKTTISTDSSFACNQVYGRWTFSVNKVNDAGVVNVYFVNDKTDATSNSGYYFSFGTDEKFYLYSIASGTATARITSSGTYSLSTNYVIEILRNTNGAFTLTANEASVGNVTNTTYTSSNYCFIDVGAGDVVSSLAFEYGEGSLDLSSYERLLHSDNANFANATGITWANNGSYNFARSTATPITGTASFRGVIGSGDATTNNITLPYTSLVTIEAGKKYTLEFNTRDSSYASGDSIYCKIGDKQKGIAYTDANTKKYVYNFQATTNTTKQNIVVWTKCVSGTRVVKVDDVSLTQAYDVLVSVWAKSVSTSATGRALVDIGHTVSSATKPRFTINRTSGNRDINVILLDGANIVVNSSINANFSGLWDLVQIRIDRISTFTAYYNGSAVLSNVSLAALGKMVYSIATLGYKAPSESGFSYFDGSVGEVQIVKFDDIAQSNVSASTLLSAYRGGLATWTGGIPVAWYKWRGVSDAQMLRDYSNSANNLSGTNVTTADQERGTYPSK